MDATDVTAVLAKARQGDSDAFRTLVEQHSRRAFQLAYRITGNEHDAEDVVQESFIRAYRQLGRFEARAHFSTWLHRIVANCSVDLIRSRRARYDHTSTANGTGVGYVGRYPLGGAWRIGPRVLVERIVSDSGPVQYTYTPYLHTDWQRNGRMVEIELGTEIGRNPQILEIGNSTRLFVSIGYRVNF